MVTGLCSGKENENCWKHPVWKQVLRLTLETLKYGVFASKQFAASRMPRVYTKLKILVTSFARQYSSPEIN